MSDQKPIPLPRPIIFSGISEPTPVPSGFHAALAWLERKYQGLPHHPQVINAFKNDIDYLRRRGCFEDARRVHLDRIEAGLAPMNSALTVTMTSTDPSHDPIVIQLWDPSDPPAVYGVHWMGPARP